MRHKNITEWHYRAWCNQKKYFGTNVSLSFIFAVIAISVFVSQQASPFIVSLSRGGSTVIVGSLLKPTAAYTSATPPGSSAQAVLGASITQPAGYAIGYPSTGAYWGIYRDTESNGFGSLTIANRQAAILDAESKIGRKYDFDRQFFQWSDTIPNAYVSWTTGQGRYPYISLFAKNRSTGKPTKWADIAAGKTAGSATNDLDNYLLANVIPGLKTLGPTLFTFHHEPEDEICPGDTTVGCDFNVYYGTKQDYKDAWAHIVSLFNSNGVTNVDYVWVSTGYRFNDANDYRYGPALCTGVNNLCNNVEWIAADPYNYITSGQPFNGNSWQDLKTIMQPWYNWASGQGKPLALAEFGVLEYPGNTTKRAVWMDQARADIKASFPKIKALSYFDSYPATDPGSDWRLFTGSSAQASKDAYIAWSQDYYFNQRFGTAPASGADNAGGTSTSSSSAAAANGSGSASSAAKPNGDTSVTSTAAPQPELKAAAHVAAEAAKKQAAVQAAAIKKQNSTRRAWAVSAGLISLAFLIFASWQYAKHRHFHLHVPNFTNLSRGAKVRSHKTIK
jgi:hypothetical protein